MELMIKPTFSKEEWIELRKGDILDPSSELNKQVEDYAGSYLEALNEDKVRRIARLKLAGFDYHEPNGKLDVLKSMTDWFDSFDDNPPITVGTLEVFLSYFIELHPYCVDDNDNLKPGKELLLATGIKCAALFSIVCLLSEYFGVGPNSGATGEGASNGRKTPRFTFPTSPN